MAGSRMTFVAEFVDRLTGPSTKAKKAVEDLGKATAEAAKKSEQANRRAETADQKRATTSKRATEDVRRSEGRKATAAAGSAAAAERASRTVEGAERRRQRASRDTATVVGRAAGQQRRASQTTAQAIQNHGRRINTTLGGTRSASARTADAIQQMAGRSNRAVSGMQRGMDRINPGRMASRYNSALGRMLGKTESATAKIKGRLDSITSSGAFTGAATGGALVAGASLVGGTKRIDDQQQAQVIMEQMPELSDKDRNDLMDMYKGQVQKSTTTMGSAAMFGSGLISAGMDKGGVQQAVRGGIDTAALYGMSLDEMALPLKKMQAKGKLDGEVADMLRDRNIPLDKWLGAQKGVDQAKIAKMISAGQISSDDVFKAMADNTKGGAERASKTFKGMRTNFLTSFSQAGESFLMPLLPGLTSALDTFTDSMNKSAPFFQTLGTVGGGALKIIAPLLPVVVPGMIALGGALVVLKVASTVASGVQALAIGSQLLMRVLGGRGRGRGATGAVGLFTEFLGGMRDGAREAYGQRGLGGLNAGLDTSTKKMGKAKGAAKGLRGALGGLAGGALKGGAALGIAGIAGAGMNAATPSGVTGDGAMSNATAGGSKEIDDRFKNAKYANGNAGWFQRFWRGNMKNINNTGDVVAQISDRGVLDRFSDGLSDAVGFETSTSAGKQDLSGVDSELASMVQSGDLAGAGSRFNQIVFQTEAAGKTQQDAMKLFPSYKDAVYDVFKQRSQAVDDNQVLQAMRSDKGFLSGGFTGMGAASAPAGVVHGREYVMPESVTSRPGMLPALRQIHRTGEVPRTYHGDTTSVQVSVNAAGATVEAAQAVGQSVEEAVNRVLARRERRASNRHGTRELRGAN